MNNLGKEVFQALVRRRGSDWGVSGRASWCAAAWRKSMSWPGTGFCVLFASINMPPRSVSLYQFHKLQRMLCPRLHRGEKSSIKKSIRIPLLVIWYILWKSVCISYRLFWLHAILLQKHLWRQTHSRIWCLWFFPCCADFKNSKWLVRNSSLVASGCGQRSASCWADLALKAWLRLHMCEAQKIKKCFLLLKTI